MKQFSIRFSLATLFVVACSIVFSGPLGAQQTKRQYQLGADSQRQASVPMGTVENFEWLDSKVFPGTKRRYYVYVPAQYDESEPAALMVFQDGHAYVGENGSYRAPIVFDNLIHRRELPVTICVFIDPGHKKDELPQNSGWKPTPKNRSFEYDSLGNQYSRLLLEEILPVVESKYNITQDPNGRAIGGASSGGICAFTVAWERPDKFGKVLSHIGSFTNIRHGDTYPGIIRKTETKMVPALTPAPDESTTPDTEAADDSQEKTDEQVAESAVPIKTDPATTDPAEQVEPKPLRIYLQDGKTDLDNEHGNWPLANQQ
ncbi:MAG: enterochelin esterase-like enzyme, partial [Mariniblastus sp.]